MCERPMRRLRGGEGGVLRRPRRRVLRARGAVRLRQVHASAHGRRARERDSGEIRIGRRRQRSRADGARHRHGVPELRALPAYVRVRQHGLWAAQSQHPEGRDRRAGEGGGAHPRARARCSTASRASSPAVSASASPWGAPSCASRRAFLFDEPLSNLDAKLRVQMRIEIRRLQRALKTTSIYVTHDQMEAMTLADRLVVMNGGRMEQVGTAIEVFQKPATVFVAGFIGSPPMNFLPATVEAPDRLRLADGAALSGEAIRGAPAPGTKVTAGLRPEAVTLKAVERKLRRAAPQGRVGRGIGHGPSRPRPCRRHRLHRGAGADRPAALGRDDGDRHRPREHPSVRCDERGEAVEPTRLLRSSAFVVILVEGRCVPRGWRLSP